MLSLTIKWLSQGSSECIEQVVGNSQQGVVL